MTLDRRSGIKRPRLCDEYVTRQTPRAAERERNRGKVLACPLPLRSLGLSSVFLDYWTGVVCLLTPNMCTPEARGK